MAAGVPVVSTSVGAEGLSVPRNNHIRLGDSPQAFAEQCCRLLLEDAEGHEMAAIAQSWVAANYSWESAAGCFERILDST
jgi:glycosyltransferase involved in cell wall biosynthesis